MQHTHGRDRLCVWRMWKGEAAIGLPLLTRSALQFSCLQHSFCGSCNLNAGVPVDLQRPILQASDGSQGWQSQVWSRFAASQLFVKICELLRS